MTAEQEIQFRFEGGEVRSAAGVSLASALASAGEYGLRCASDDDMRGMFCGIGVCQECLVEIAGQGRVRACMTLVSESMDVRRAGRLASPADVTADSGPAAEPAIEEPDVLIVGGGPAGLTAAASLAGCDLNVVVLDERHAPGGQYYKQPVNADRMHPSLGSDHQIADGAALVERANASGARLLSNCEVWGAFTPTDFFVLHDGRTTLFRPKRTVVATGAYERGLPLPGWTLPGVMTSGAAQTMLKSYGALPGQRALVCGNGPLNLQIALELVNAGVEVVAVTELAQAIFRRAGAASRMLWHDRTLTIRGLRTIRALKAGNVPLYFGHGLESVKPSHNGLRAWVGRLQGNKVKRDHAFDVDVVCTGFGFQPNNEVLRALGCRHEFDEKRGQLVVVRSDDCETSVAGVYAIGDCCGLGGAPAACEEGIIAAAAVLRSLSCEVPSELVRDEHAARRRLSRHHGFQTALWQMFSAPRLQTDLADDDTIVCRCENVRLGQLISAIDDGDKSIGALKRRTRLGMGACQGRYCGPVAADLVAQRTGTKTGEYSFFAPRVPIKPTKISDIVS